MRIPNIFTVPSNVLAGYFTLSSLQNLDYSLIGLIFSSIFLYLSGIVFNDYFDLDVDRKERPTRPLPAGLVSKKMSLLIAISLMVIGNIITFSINFLSFLISMILSVIILLYDYRIKFTNLGPIIMGTARALNVTLGASIVFYNINQSIDLIKITIAVSSIFFYVISIMMLSKYEVIFVSGSKSRLLIPFIFVFGIIISLSIFTVHFQIFEISTMIFLALFVVIVIYLLKKTILEKYREEEFPFIIQTTIKNMIISIIILDSAIISGSVGLSYGIATLFLIFPSVILAKKLYVT